MTSQTDSSDHPQLLLHQLLELVKEDTLRVEGMIRDSLNHTIDLIPEVGGHLIKAGGKRLRPVLLVACARLCGYQGQEHIKLATCIEFIHNATLLHDDVMDKSYLRRGKPTAHEIWGVPASVVVGDFLLCRALELMTDVESWPIVRLINQMATRIIEGQALDLSWEHKIDMTEEDFFHVIHLKTAWLFQTACELGAMLSLHPEQENLRNFGYHLGMAFQLIDDVLDYTSTAPDLGKNPGQDFREGKITLPVILAFERATPEEKDFWNRTIGKQQQTPEDFIQALQIMSKHNVFEEVTKRAMKFLANAEENLSPFPPSPLKTALQGVLQFIYLQS